MTTTYGYRVVQDEYAENPRTAFENLCVMDCKHPRYNLGDKIVKSFDSVAARPLFLLDHSGLSISMRDFADRWDSGCVGAIHMPADKASELLGKKIKSSDDLTDEDRIHIKICMEREVETYDAYLKGEVYSFEVFKVETCNLGHKHETVIESCGGFYDRGDAETEADICKVHYESRGR